MDDSNASYCCQCGNGPWLWSLYLACLMCDHEPCDTCVQVYVPLTSTKNSSRLSKTDIAKKPSSNAEPISKGPQSPNGPWIQQRQADAFKKPSSDADPTLTSPEIKQGPVDTLKQLSSNAKAVSKSPGSQQHQVSNHDLQATTASDDDEQRSARIDQLKSTQGLKDKEKSKPSILSLPVTTYRSKEGARFLKNNYISDGSGPFNFSWVKAVLFLCSTERLEKRISHLINLFDDNLSLIQDQLECAFSRYFQQLSSDAKLLPRERKHIDYFINEICESTLCEILFNQRDFRIPFRMSRKDVLGNFLGEEVVKFLLQGSAFSNLCKDIRELAGPKESETRQLIQRLEECYAKRWSTSGAGAEIEEDRLRQLCCKLHRTSTPRILVKLEIVSPEARIQRWFELKTKSTWDWWPLSQPLHSSSRGRAWIFQWSCECGQEHMESLPYDHAKKLSSFYLSEKAPYDVDAQGLSSASGPSGAPPAQSATATAAISPTQGNRNSRSYSETQQIINSPQTNAATSNAGYYQGTSLEYFVFLAVNAGYRHRLAQLSVNGLGDDHFFKLLKDQYLRIRGSILNIFSIWKFSHCDFIMIQKVHADEIVPRDIGMPDDHDTEYSFAPRPADPMPPIDREEFKMRFYNCFNGGTRHKHYLRSCRKAFCRSNDVLECIPKRNRKLVEDGLSREMFWGLQAKEELSFIRVAVYHILLIAIPFVFFGLWLSVMGHQGDLQDASVPIVVLGVLLSLFWFPLFHR